jgi:cobalt-zinc-cadmium efflux system outer membrane protein
MERSRIFITSVHLVSLLCLTGAAGLAAEPPTVTGTITLREALAAALLGNPEISAAAGEIRMRDGLAVQAGLLPNPSLSAELENVGGSGDFEGVDSAESTLKLSQLIELGGKRGKRMELAALERDSARWDYEVRRVTTLADTARAFIAVVALQQRVEIIDSVVRLTSESAAALDEQLRAGAAQPAEAMRARVAVGQAEILRTQRAGELAAARVQLSALWGSARPGFDRAIGALDAIAPPPPLDTMLAGIEGNPDLARWATALAQRDASVRVEQSRAVPDVTVTAGPRYFSDTQEVGLVFELGLPLPIFDRNQGAIAAARAERDRADAERQAARTAVHSELLQAYEQLRAAYEQAVALRERMVPAAEAARRRTDEAYRAGAVRALDVLDAQRTAFELRDQAVEALAAYHVALVDVERLSGAGLDPTKEWQ